MNTIFLFVSAVLFALYSIATKFIPAGHLRLNMLVVAAFSVPSFLAFFAMALVDGGTLSGVTLLYGSLWGSVCVVTEITYFLAMQSGPLSYTSFIFSASMVIPTLVGAVIWKETIAPLQWVGIVLFLAAFYLICVPGAEGSGKIKKSWLPLCLAAFFSNGLLALFIKAQQIELAGGESSQMMAVSFGSCGLVAFLAFLIWAPIMREKLFPPQVRTGMKKALLPILGIAASNGAGNGFVTYLSSRVPGALMYPCILGGSMLLVTLFSAIGLREKVNRWGWLGLGVGLAAMIVLNV